MKNVVKIKDLLKITDKEKVYKILERDYFFEGEMKNLRRNFDKTINECLKEEKTEDNDWILCIKIFDPYLENEEDIQRHLQKENPDMDIVNSLKDYGKRLLENKDALYTDVYLNHMVDGKVSKYTNTDSNINYGLGLEHSKAFVNYIVDEDTLNNFTNAEILAHALYELTYYGWLNKDRLLFENDILERMDSKDNLVDFEDLFENLNKKFDD